MRLRVPALLMIALHSVAFGQTHFKQVRPVIVSDPAKQAFLAVDESILQRIRSDMGDIRLFSASGKEVPYVLRTQRAVRYSDWTSMQVVNKGTLNGQTQFTVDVSVPEYDGVELDLATKNFVTRAGVEGADDAAAKVWNNLGAYSIYDFTKEKLGSSKIIHLKTPVRYRFLRITIGGEVMPEDVQGVNIANFQEDKAHFVPLSPQARIEQLGNHTTASWNASEKLPIERIGVEVEPSEVNFSRDATLYCDDRLVSHNNLSRVRLVRKGRQIESESLAIEPSALRCKSYRLDIFNGDNPPLHITAVKPMMLERRIYFDPQGETEFKLYYEDEKTGAPVYDYAKFFEPAEAEKVAATELKAEASNPSFTDWPDDRPFTERHPAVLWIAMLVAVGLLGAWALKGFKS